ncbi:MAG: hypothetical protein ACR2QK_07975 [Acidimicrobiales bacterium]
MFPVAPPVEGRDWLSTNPIPWPDFRGRVVVVLFWSFGCEASLLAVRQLTELARVWPSEVTVLAVHTPRFPYEDDLDRLVAAVARYRISLPVVHDPDYVTWNRYNPGGWPATAVVDRKGRVIGMSAGTTDAEVIDEAVAAGLAPTGRQRPQTSDRSIDVDRANPDPGDDSAAGSQVHDRPSENGSTLRFPSAVAATASGLVAIADSGHDRLLIGEMDPDLRTLRPEVELTDIDDPSGIAFASDSVLYVIERGTGSVLQVDLEFGTLDVLADEELAAPTALVVDRDGSLVVADAGHDQLLRIAGGPDGDVIIGTIAGTGISGWRDGRAATAELAQPVGLARVPSGIAFCDAASSNVRLLSDDGQVLTVTGNDFFDWGLVDGPAHSARLQRPGALCSTAAGSLAIADTGNDRIRLLEDRRVRTLGLSGLDQPSGLAALESGQLIVADTGNHRLVVADPALKTGWPLAVYPATMTSVWDTAIG